jgi:hypothetical protein
MLLTLPAETKNFYCVYYPLLELLGGDQADEIFSSAELDPFDLKAQEYFGHGSLLLEKVTSELLARFGEDVTRGLLIRMGNGSLNFFRKYFSGIGQLGSIENRLRPVDRRFLSSLNSLAEVLSIEMGENFIVTAKGGRSYSWEQKVNSENPKIGQITSFFYFGLLEEFCTWLDSRKNYIINCEVNEKVLDVNGISIEIRELD